MKIALCLYGYINSKATKTSHCAYSNGFKHLFDKVMVYNPDVFIHSWETEKEDDLVEKFKPKLYTFETQRSFDNQLKTTNWSRFSTSYQKPFNAFSSLYSVKKSNQIKIMYEKEHGFKYDCVILSRFDVGYHFNGRNKTSIIDFNPNYDMKNIYTAYWDQINAGISNHWIYSNSKSMDLIANMYDHVVEYLKPNSEYITEMMSGMFDTNKDDWFSNEYLKDTKTVKLHKYTEGYCLNIHTMYKWHFYKMGFWKNDKCKFLNEELWK